MPDLAPTQAVECRVGHFGCEVLFVTTLEQINRDEQGCSVGQEVSHQMAQAAVAPQEELDAVLGKLKLVSPGLQTRHFPSPCFTQRLACPIGKRRRTHGKQLAQPQNKSRNRKYTSGLRK